MLALNNLPKYENGKSTKILKPWLNVFNDYLVILLLTVPILVGGIELASGRYVCVPVVDCSMSNNASTLLSKIKYHNVCRAFYSSQKSTGIKGKATTVVTKLEYARDYDYVNSECRKTALPWFHSYFSLLLFGQAFILLLMNNLWLKYPWTSSTVNTFYALAEECYNLPGAHFARLTLNKDQKSKRNPSIEQTPLVPSGSQRNIVEHIQLYSQGEDSVSVGVDLSTAVAVKTLYEKIGRFNDYVGTSKKIRNVYLIQALLQASLTVIFFTLNVLLKDDIKGTAKCSVDEHFPVIYDYFTCSHNLSKLLERALVLFLCILGAFFVFCIIVVLWTIHKVFWTRKYYFKDALNEWRLPRDLKPAQGDMGFLLHLLHAYDKLYTVQFAIYMSEEHNRKVKTLILDNEWPVEKLERCFYKDTEGQPRRLCLMGLSGIPNALFQLGDCIATLQVLHLNGCGPLQDYDFDQFGFFVELQSLSLVSCGLTKIPKNVFLLEKLKFLCLKDNLIKEIQSGIRSLTMLLEFDISHNNLISIDRSIGTLSSLTNVNISNNPYMRWSVIRNVLACEKLGKLTVSRKSEILQRLRTEEDRIKFDNVAEESQENT